MTGQAIAGSGIAVAGRVWWRARARRERIALAALAAALALFFGWYGLVAPLHSWRAAAAERRADAALALARVEADLAEIAALRRTRAAAAELEPLLLDSAREAGIAVSRQRRDDAGNRVVGIDAVDAPALFAWLDLLRAEHGLGPQRLLLEKADGRLRAELVFPATP
jgi:general secretion pathway protein M